MAHSSEIDLLESFSPNPKGALVTVGFGQPKLNIVENDKSAPAPAEVAALLQRIPPRFVVDESNRLRERADTSLNPRLPPALREGVAEYMTQICNGYESSTFIIPNRKVARGETWPVKLPMLLKTGKKAKVIDLVMTCAYEGIRASADGPEALVTFTGKVQGRDAGNDHLDGDVSGKFTFDVQRGFISSSRLTISSEATAPDDLQIVLSFDVDLTRLAGNPRGISLPATPAAPVAAAPARPARPSESANASRPDRPEASGDFPFKGVFQKPAASATPTTYMKVISSRGEFIGAGKTYDYPSDQIKIHPSQRGVSILVDGWHCEIGAPRKQFLKVGEYPGATRFAFSGDAPGIDFFGKGRGNNKVIGAFAVWELEVTNDQITKLAIDFEQRSAPAKPALTGKIRLNSSFE